MLFTQDDKKLGLRVIGYQFPEITKNSLYDDGNWLDLEISYTANSRSNPSTRIDACIETWDIDHLAKTLKQMLDGTQTQYVSDFLEPYLVISITKLADKFQFDCSYCYEIDKNDDWKTWEVSTLLDRNQVTELIDELTNTYATYPARTPNLFNK